MINSLKYREVSNFKESNLEWLGQIPIEWNTKSMKFICSINTGDKDTVNRVDDGKYPFFVRSQNVERIDTYSFDGEAILTPGDGQICEIFHHINGKFDFHQRVYKLSDFKNYHARYLYYYLFAKMKHKVYALSAKATVDSLRLPMLKDFECLYFDIIEQQKIANFLDIKSVEFDSIIKKKELLIKKLEEAKKSLISEVVTGKVKIVDGKIVPRNDEEMRGSGVDWLGMIPIQWTVSKLFFILENITDGAHISPETENGVYPFLSVKDLKKGKLDFENCLKTSTANYTYLFRNSCNPCKGDVLISKDGTIGATTTIDFDRKFVVASSLVIMKPQSAYASRYLEYLLNANYFQGQLKLYTKGAALPRVSINNIKNSLILSTSNMKEQEEIVNYLDSNLIVLDRLIDKAIKQVELLKQAKESLITEAVTGKIDLRDWEITNIEDSKEVVA